MNLTSYLVLLDKVITILTFLSKLGTLLKPVMPRGLFDQMVAVTAELTTLTTAGSLSTAKVPRTFGAIYKGHSTDNDYVKSLAHFINTISVFYGCEAAELVILNLDAGVRFKVIEYLQRTSIPKIYWVAALTSLVNQYKQPDEQAEIIMFMTLLSTINVSKEGEFNYVDLDAIQFRNYSLKKCFVRTESVNEPVSSLSDYWNTFKNTAANGWTTFLKNLAPEPSITQTISVDQFFLETPDDNVTGFSISNPSRFNDQLFPNKY